MDNQVTQCQVIPFLRRRAKSKTGFEVFDFWNPVVACLPVQHRPSIMNEAHELGLITESDREKLLMPVPYSTGSR